MEQAAGPWQTLRDLRRLSPLVHNITNTVAMDLAASLLLAAGALPLMTHAREEVEDAVAEADTVTINIGSLSAERAEAMVEGARKAVDLGKPWVLDPVGCAAIPFRAEIARRLSRLQPTVIRGNGSEILTLGGGDGPARGVQDAIESPVALDAAYDLARGTGAVVAVTGAVDYVTDGKALVAVANGHDLMGKVAALGCALTCLIGGCCAVNPDPMAATIHALVMVGLSGELAAAGARGPASFRMQLIDALHGLDEAAISDGARIQ